MVEWAIKGSNFFDWFFVDRGVPPDEQYRAQDAAKTTCNEQAGHGVVKRVIFEHPYPLVQINVGQVCSKNYVLKQKDRIQVGLDLVSSFVLLEHLVRNFNFHF